MKHGKPLETLGLREINPGVWSGSHGWSTDSGRSADRLDQPGDRAAPGAGARRHAGRLRAGHEFGALRRGCLAARAGARSAAKPYGKSARNCAAFKDALGSLVSLENGKIKAEGDGEVQEMIDIADFAVGQVAHAVRQYHALGTRAAPHVRAVASAGRDWRDFRV